MRTKNCSRRTFRLVSEPLEPRQLLAPAPVISELMAINRQTLADQDGDFSDWIEIYNPTAEAADLDGWYLTDTPDQLTRWRLPHVVVGANDYLVVFASGKDRTDPQTPLHTNFRLSGKGEFLALVGADGVTIKHQYAPAFPAQIEDVAYGLAADLKSMVYLSAPTPGKPNTEGRVGVVAAPQVSVERGFHDAPFDVEITSDTAQAEIRYTLSGKRPTATSGVVYQGPIHVDKTTTLRVGAFRPGYLDSEITTHTYLFLDEVLTQTRPDGYPDLPAGDYNVIPQVVDYHRDTILDDLKAVPTMSFVLDVDDMFGPAGTYITGQDNPTSVEMIYPDGRQGFQIDAGVRQQGGTTRMKSVPKHAFRLRFQSDYGPPKLDFPLFDDSPVTRFDTIILRANAQDGWQRGAAGKDQMIKDEFARRTQLDMGNLSSHGGWVHLYINGLYWGLYNMVERPDASFTSEHLGGAKEDWDALNKGALRDGNLEAWDAMLALTPRGGPDVRNFDDAKVAANYQAIQQYLDIPEFVDYVLIGMYLGTEDWLPNNYYAGRRSRDGDGPVDLNDPASKFRFFHWDQEESLLGVDKFKELPGFRSPVGRIYQLLRLSPDFRDLQAQRIYERMFNGGPLSPEAAAARYQSLVEEVQDAIKGEDIRWGQAPSNMPAWHAEADSLIREYFPNRREGVLDLYRRFRLYPKTDAPVLNQQGGRIAATDPLVMTANGGTIYYTLDGSDPRLADGSVAPSAIEYAGPILLSENALVRARALADGEWSVRNEAQFFVGDPLPAGAVAITEINYHPSDPTADELAVDGALESDDFEFIELYNTTDQVIDLTGARFTNGIDFTFGAVDAASQPMRIAPGQYVVIVANAPAFQTRYDTDQIRVAGTYTGHLDNRGEPIRLEGPFGATWLDFRYDDAAGWPRRADGAGATLQLRDPAATDPAQYDYGPAWRGSTAHGGTPGAAAVAAPTVVINEVLSRGDRAQPDAVELHNRGDQTIDVGGWLLSDSSDNFGKYSIPAGTTIGAGQYLVLDESHFNPNPEKPGPNDFALSGTRGDDVWLVIPDASGNVGSFVDDVHFGPAGQGESLGRTPGGPELLAPMARVTLGGENSAPRVGPVVISQLQYKPGPPSPAALQIAPELSVGDLEFIELQNSTGQTVDLSTWRVRGGIDFDFADGTSLGPGQALLIVPFDPADPSNAARLAGFRAHYGIDDRGMVVGGFSGQLRDGGERITLRRAEQLSPDDPTSTVWRWEDEVIYDDADPWPVATDGTALSLTRTAPVAWGNAPSSWAMRTPTPGLGGSIVVRPGDANQDGTFDQQDIQLVAQAGKYLTGQPASLAEGDFNGDGVFNQLDIVVALQMGFAEQG